MATARSLLDAGAHVQLLGLDVALGRRAAEQLNGGSTRAIFWPADVRSSRELKTAFMAIDEEFGRVDILVCSAGIPAVGSVDTIDEALWDKCFDTNLKGAFLAAREAVPRMRQGGGGVIVNVASNAGLVARGSEPAYCASKAGLIMLTRSLALEHAGDRIRANAVAPGPVDNTRIMDRTLAEASDPAAAWQELVELAPLAKAYGRMISPFEVADAILFLCRPQSAMITGAVLTIDAGKSAGIAR